MKVPVMHWSRHMFDEFAKSDHVTNNITECFNNWINKFRGQLALTMFENIRRKMMKRIHKRLQDAAKWGSGLPPLVSKKVALSQDKWRFVQVMCASNVEYEVKDGNKYNIVKLDVKTCDCGYWAVSGILC
ncbi:hypothetical protein ACOSQ4_018355 [Xanthoceras sorbifolium]